MSDEVYRCKTCRCPVTTSDDGIWVHQFNGIIISRDCVYRDCRHKELHKTKCMVPEPDFECPLRYDWDARHYWILPRINTTMIAAMQMFEVD